MKKLKSVEELEQELEKRKHLYILDYVRLTSEKVELENLFKDCEWAWEEEEPMKEEQQLQKLRMITPQVIKINTEELKTKVCVKLNELNFTWCNSQLYCPEDLEAMIYPLYLCPLEGTWGAKASSYTDGKRYTPVSAEEWLQRFGEDQDQEQEELHYETERAPKFDQDPYEKVKLWEVPIGFLKSSWKRNDPHAECLFLLVHNELFAGQKIDHTAIAGCLNTWIKENSILLRELATAFSYGSEKYEFASWRKGFDGSIRLYEAMLRHLQSYLEGIAFDGQAVGKFTKGNNHRGAAVFSCFIALKEEGILDIYGVSK